MQLYRIGDWTTLGELARLAPDDGWRTPSGHETTVLGGIAELKLSLETRVAVQPVMLDEDTEAYEVIRRGGEEQPPRALGWWVPADGWPTEFWEQTSRQPVRMVR